MFTLSRDEVRELDRRAINAFGVPGVVLMENAGRGCAELLMRLNPERKPVVILCGPGNNGGDGFVIARHLDNHGWPVKVWLLADAKKLTADAAVNCGVAKASGLVGDQPSVLDGWVVDALFGTGLSRALEEPHATWVAGINASRCPVLAIDIPSGLDCDTGEPLGPTVKAAHTATFVAHKRGFINTASKSWTGEVHVIDIGAPRVLVDEYRQKTGDRPA
ncbi:nad h-hydrate epimerase : NAD(P)H-hydrate epimerase OS=Planctomyces maris DSM 8797 GN=nnrE PE=3 SV=1: YjeF_N [Gemmata massiliana]|uniref:NAD(P)H-hydrate epimerase n=1 Tax=Gemmata massiliana TaxID=1210884 RepID=A0A6P2CV24_9BACT|nr:NAD(P)H-hydrate epimerase [Gemmata massiliana]VTR93008.1 nad h-hydrate epimerase : NAD(P)H-hydrate epimerase OS=Planctomyces maris DSM 8797 GN=nnrE PE=3 SV=1: YjeF_N [Gemmata massiliana]